MFPLSTIIALGTIAFVFLSYKTSAQKEKAMLEVEEARREMRMKQLEARRGNAEALEAAREDARSALQEAIERLEAEKKEEK